MVEHRGWIHRGDRQVRKELPEDADRELWLPLYCLPDVTNLLRRAMQDKTEEIVSEMRELDTAPTVFKVANKFIHAIEMALRAETDRVKKTKTPEEDDTGG